MSKKKNGKVTKTLTIEEYRRIVERSVHVAVCRPEVWEHQPKTRAICRVIAEERSDQFLVAARMVVIP